MKLTTLAIVAFIGKCSAVKLTDDLSYEDALRAIANNKVDNVYDDSHGAVYFNTKDYGLEDHGFPVLDNFGIDTHSTFNYLTSLTKLARQAADKQKYGDVALLLYKFLYAGNAEATKIDPNSDMVIDMINEFGGKSNKRNDNRELLNMLSQSVSTPEVEDLFTLVSNGTPQKDGLDKRWTKEKCLKAHKAVKNACWDLLSRVKIDASTKTGGPRNIEYQGCFISWSANATFQIRNLTNAANLCLQVCAGSYISCEVWGVSLNGTIVNQCLSNRAGGCK